MKWTPEMKAAKDTLHPDVNGLLRSDKKTVVIYARISACCSACAPKSLTKEQVQDDVDKQLAMSHGRYEAVDVASIRPGQSSPSPCNVYPGTRLHWFLIRRRSNVRQR